MKKEKATVAHLDVHTPLGVLRISADERGLCAARFQTKKSPTSTRIIGSPSSKQILLKAKRSLERYFRGEKRALEKIPLSVQGSEFHQKVWKELCNIRQGKTLSYGEIAHKVGSPRAARAVGTACGSNPVCLFVPCHRVLPASGGVGQYGEGPWRKKFLLELEGAIVAR